MVPMIHLSGQENGSDLLDLRRELIKERRIRKASRIVGSVLPVKAAPAADVIEFPSPEFPRIA